MSLTEKGVTNRKKRNSRMTFVVVVDWNWLSQCELTVFNIYINTYRSKCR